MSNSRRSARRSGRCGTSATTCIVTLASDHRGALPHVPPRRRRRPSRLCGDPPGLPMRSIAGGRTRIELSMPSQWPSPPMRSRPLPQRALVEAEKQSRPQPASASEHEAEPMADRAASRQTRNHLALRSRRNSAARPAAHLPPHDGRGRRAIEPVQCRRSLVAGERRLRRLPATARSSIWRAAATDAAPHQPGTAGHGGGGLAR